MEHYRALKWGGGAAMFSPLVIFVTGHLYMGWWFGPLVNLAALLVFESYLGFIFYCVLCVPVPRRILLLASGVLILATGALFFQGPAAAAFVLGPGLVLCVLGGLPRWIALGVTLFIFNTLLLFLSSPLFGGPGGFVLPVYVFLAYCGLGIAVLPNLDWRAYWRLGHRSAREAKS